MVGLFPKKLAGLACALHIGLGLVILLSPAPAKAGDRSSGKPTAAIIADRSEQAVALADLLFADLSKSARVDLIERAELNKIRAEQELQLSFGAQGGKSRRQLGTLLRADFLFLLRRIGTDASPALAMANPSLAIEESKSR